jgi:hypothetical protein
MIMRFFEFVGRQIKVSRTTALEQLSARGQLVGHL